MKQVFLLALLLVGTFAFYDGTTDVVKLTVDNFNTEVIESDDFWLVEFFAPWCGHCKKLTPEWERAAKGLKGIVRMGGLDMTTDGDAGKDYGIEGYPTLKWFGEDKSEPTDFDGGRTSTGIINFAIKKLKEVANTRIGNKKRAKPEKKEEKAEEKQEEQDNSAEDDVFVVTDDNFADEVEGSKDAWFIEFYAPWCGHCKNLAPTWKKLATALKGNVRVGKVDSTQNSEISQRFGVKGYPSLKFFPAGSKSDSLVEDHNGSRDFEDLQQWAEEKAALSQPAKFKQLINQEDYDVYCKNNKGVCITVFLPSLYESTAEQRNSYISQIEEVANSMKGKPFTFLWSEGGQQYEFEQSFNIGGSGYPAVLAVTTRKSSYTNLKQAFSSTNLQGFVDRIGNGREPFAKFNHEPTVKSVSEWDGKDIEKRQEDL